MLARHPRFFEDVPPPINTQNYSLEWMNVLAEAYGSVPIERNAFAAGYLDYCRATADFPPDIDETVASVERDYVPMIEKTPMSVRGAYFQAIRLFGRSKTLSDRANHLARKDFVENGVSAVERFELQQIQRQLQEVDVKLNDLKVDPYIPYDFRLMVTDGILDCRAVLERGSPGKTSYDYGSRFVQEIWPAAVEAGKDLPPELQ